MIGRGNDKYITGKVSVLKLSPKNESISYEKLDLSSKTDDTKYLQSFVGDGRSMQSTSLNDGNVVGCCAIKRGGKGSNCVVF